MQLRAFPLFVAVLLVASITACTSRNISDSIAEQYKKSNGTLVSLAVAAPGGWDLVCVLGPYANNEVAKKTLGFDWDAESKSSISSSDAITLLIFVKNKEVISYVEHPRGNGDFSNLSSKCFTQSEAVFFYDANPNVGWPGLRPKNAA